MNFIKAFFHNLLITGFTVCLLSPAVARDTSVDCAGRPRWDRFVIDEKATKWDPASAKCYDTLSTEVMSKNAAAMYGAPGLYGEFNDDDTVVVNSKDYRAMYGVYDESEQKVVTPEPKPEPAKVAAAPKPKPVAKPVPKPKKEVVTKPVVAKKPATPKPVSEPTPVSVPTPPVVIPVTEPLVVKPKPLPDPNAKNIARTLNTRVDVDSYCTQINPPILGPLPPGLVLMPGRTDLMSCVSKNQN